jgi:hypothetical protein
MTSGISRSAGDQTFEGAHRGRVCVRVFIGVSVCACCECLRCTVSFSKKNDMGVGQERPLFDQLYVQEALALGVVNK